MFTTRKCSVLQKTQLYKKYCDVAKVSIHICFGFYYVSSWISELSERISHNCNLTVHMNAIYRQIHCALKQLLYEKKNATSMNRQMI